MSNGPGAFSAEAVAPPQTHMPAGHHRRRAVDGGCWSCSMLPLLLAGLALLSVRCSFTTLWYPEGFETGKVLDQGEHQVTVSSIHVVPADVAYAWGMGDGFEAQVGLGCPGLFDADGTGLDNIFAPPMAGPSFTVRRSVIAADPTFLSWSAGAAGFFMPYPYTFDSRNMYGGEASGGVSLGYYPRREFGVFLPVKGAVVVATHHNYHIAAIPGIGLSVEPGSFLIRAAANYPLEVLSHGDGGNFDHLTLRIWPYVGMQIGYRW